MPREFDNLCIRQRHKRDRSPIGSGVIVLVPDLPGLVIAHCDLREGFLTWLRRRCWRNGQQMAHKLFVEWDRPRRHDNSDASESTADCLFQVFESLLQRAEGQSQFVDRVQEERGDVGLRQKPGVQPRFLILV